ncbi:HAD-like domain-containing protein [Phlebopus sp. FC_14]|nr:HAD-like domain-containing protein [Phlebopus sp. FC_14]
MQAVERVRILVILCLTANLVALDEHSFWDDEIESDAESTSDVTDNDGVVLKGGAGIPVDSEGIPRPLLPPIASAHTGRKCLVLDLDETLIHTTFEPTPMTEFLVPVRIERQWEIACVNKRPGVDNFLKKMGEIYEVVVFTASLSDYASPVIDKLDVHRVISHRLFRESCYRHKGNYVKDLSRLGRPMAEIVLVDNNPSSYYFQPKNGVSVKTWTSNPADRELDSLCDFLTEISGVSDVRDVLDGKPGVGQQESYSSDNNANHSS